MVFLSTLLVCLQLQLTKKKFKKYANRFILEFSPFQYFNLVLNFWGSFISKNTGAKAFLVERATFTVPNSTLYFLQAHN